MDGAVQVEDATERCETTEDAQAFDLQVLHVRQLPAHASLSDATDEDVASWIEAAATDVLIACCSH
jgi:hypothetical protein